jgi:hypothetical protein
MNIFIVLLFEKILAIVAFAISFPGAWCQTPRRHRREENCFCLTPLRKTARDLRQSLANSVAIGKFRAFANCE